MKNKIKRDLAPKRKFGIIFLGAAVASALMLSSCTIEDVLDGADSALRDYYASELGVTTPNVEPADTAEPTAPTLEPTTEITASTEDMVPSISESTTVVETTPTETTQTEQISPEEPEAPKTETVEFSMPFLDLEHGGVDYKITQSFSSKHGGLDIGVYWGDPVLSSTDGTVIMAYNDGDISKSDLSWTYGTFVVVETVDGEYRTYYAHMSRKTVNVGDKVSKGDIIGYSGNTGRVSSSSSGPYAGTHLHFEIRKLIGSSYVKTDPKLYLPWWTEK